MSRKRLWASLVVLCVACTAQHDAGGPIATPPCTPFDVSIQATDLLPQVVWVGDEYLVAVSEGVLHILSSDGALGGNFTVIPQSEGTVAVAGEPYAWSGSSLGVLVMSNDTKTFELVRFGHDGTRLGQTTMRSVGAYPDPMVVWANDRFAVAWVDVSNNTVNLQEISPDGVPGTARQVTMADIGKPFDVVSGFASTATSYAIRTNQLPPPGGDSQVIVVIDRTSGAVQRYDGEFVGAQFVARDPVFGLLAGSSPARFETLDGSAMPGPIVNVSVTGAPMLVPTTAGYHVYDLLDSSPGAMQLDAMDLDAQGVASGPERAVATISWPPDANGATTYAGGVSRGNGYAASVYFMSGTTNPTTTLRLLQQCTP